MTRISRTAAFRSLWFLTLLSLLLVVVFVILLMWNSTTQQAKTSNDPLFMYCAAGIRVPVEKIVDQYQAESYGQPIQLQFGGSNTLLNQLEVAQVGDLYLAADDSYIDLAMDKGLVKESIPVSWIRPVVVVSKGNPKNILTADDLLREDVNVALGNPDAAAVGRKVRKLMKASGHWDALAKHKKVYLPTVNEVANAVKIGSVDAGIIWDAIVAQYPDLEAVRLPELDAGAARVTVGILTSSERPTDALRFARFFTASDKGLKIFKQQGFEAVDGDVWQEEPRITLYSGGVNRLAIQETIERFQRREGVQVDVVYNGCGILCSQMKALRQGDRHGVFPDAYFACDVSFMEQVRDLFSNPVNVSETDMVIITKKSNPQGIRTLQDLTAAGLKLGVANPDESALGALTRRLLRELGIEQEIETNVSTKTPTADLLLNQVRVGGLDAAIVYRANTSQVTSELEVINIQHPLARAVQPYAAARDTVHRRTVERLMDDISRSRSQYEAAGFRYLLDVPSP